MKVCVCVCTAGNSSELSAAELWLRNTTNVLESSRSRATVKVESVALPTGHVAPPTSSLVPPTSFSVINPFLVAFDRSTTVFQTHL